jgi:hypothetical protein
MRNHLERYALASGLRVVRLKVWRTTATPSVELVVATASAPGTYLKHGLYPLVSRFGLGSFQYVKVVDRHGKSIYERGSRPVKVGGGVGGQGMVRVQPALRGCGWFVREFGPKPPPCPAR